MTRASVNRTTLQGGLGKSGSLTATVNIETRISQNNNEEQNLRTPVQKEHAKKKKKETYVLVPS